MKKLLFLSIFALFALVSANVFGQAGQGAAPSIGSTHSYWVNGTDVGAITSGKEGSTYTWWVSDGSNNLLTPLAQTDFTATSGYNSATVDQNGIELKWNPSSAGNTYYLVVKEDGVAPLCTNVKAYAIQPQNRFELTFAALESDGATPGDDLSRCAPDISLTASGTAITYNYGTADYQFKLTATGLYAGWSFTNAFTNVLHNANSTIEYKIGAGAWTSNAASISVPANPAGTETVYFRVSVDNGTTAGTSEEGLTGQSMKLTLSNIQDAGTNAVTKITNNAGDTMTSTPAQNQTVQARPATTVIQSN